MLRVTRGPAGRTVAAVTALPLLWSNVRYLARCREAVCDSTSDGIRLYLTLTYLAAPLLFARAAELPLAPPFTVLAVDLTVLLVATFPPFLFGIQFLAKVPAVGEGSGHEQSASQGSARQ
jgi:hypothetical protein